MDATSSKIIALLALLIIRFFFGVLPFFLHKLLIQWEKECDNENDKLLKRKHIVDIILTLLQAFGGGILFGTCFVHMIPTVQESMENFQKTHNIQSEFPISLTIVSMGFLFIYFAEDFFVWFITRPLTMKIMKSIENQCGKMKCKKKVKDSSNISEETLPNKIKGNQETAKDDNQSSKSVNVFIIESEKNEIENTSELDGTKPQVDIEINEKTNENQNFHNILFILALSMHSIFEGLAIGLQTLTSRVWYLFIAISIHSITILFFISLQLIIDRVNSKLIVSFILFLSLACPLGISIGIVIHSDIKERVNSFTAIILEGLSAGTVMYMVFFEILYHEKQQKNYRFGRAICILIGFLLMALLH